MRWRNQAQSQGMVMCSHAQNVGCGVANLSWKMKEACLQCWITINLAKQGGLSDAHRPAVKMPVRYLVGDKGELGLPKWEGLPGILKCVAH